MKYVLEHTTTLLPPVYGRLRNALCKIRVISAGESMKLQSIYYMLLIIVSEDKGQNHVFQGRFE